MQVRVCFYPLGSELCDRFAVTPIHYRLPAWVPRAKKMPSLGFM